MSQITNDELHRESQERATTYGIRGGVIGFLVAAILASGHCFGQSLVGPDLLLRNLPLSVLPEILVVLAGILGGTWAGVLLARLQGLPGERRNQVWRGWWVAPLTGVGVSFVLYGGVAGWVLSGVLSRGILRLGYLVVGVLLGAFFAFLWGWGKRIQRLHAEGHEGLNKVLETLQQDRANVKWPTAEPGGPRSYSKPGDVC